MSTERPTMADLARMTVNACEFQEAPLGARYKALQMVADVFALIAEVKLLWAERDNPMMVVDHDEQHLALRDCPRCDARRAAKAAPDLFRGPNGERPHCGAVDCRCHPDVGV